jgi:hypothetical protein
MTEQRRVILKVIEAKRNLNIPLTKSETLAWYEQQEEMSRLIPPVFQAKFADVITEEFDSVLGC